MKTLNLLNPDDLRLKGCEVISVKTYINKYCQSVTPEGIHAAIVSGKIDAIRPERDLFIVMTDHTKSYTPRIYKNKRK
jgi:hypothetical protein